MNKSKTLAILGSSDLGQQIAHFAIADYHYESVVFFDDFSNEKEINGCPIIGKSKDIVNQYHKGFFDEIILGIGYKHLNKKKEIFEHLINHDVKFGKVIHSSTILDKNSSIESGCVIYPGCIIDSNTIVSSNSILNIGCTIAHDSIIGKHSFLSPRVSLAGFVKVGERCILGINTTLIDNIELVDETQTGAGTVVIRSITKSGLYVGCPHRFVR
jgi:sugar O-acyltransferase (sialic acid O-acetyltransferase NeuD family)